MWWPLMHELHIWSISGMPCQNSTMRLIDYTSRSIYNVRVGILKGFLLLTLRHDHIFITNYHISTTFRDIKAAIHRSKSCVICINSFSY